MPVHGALSGPGFRFPGPGTGRVSVECLVVMSLALDEQRGAGQHHKGYGDLHHHLEALIHQMGAGNGQIGVEIFRKGIYNSHQELIDQEQQNRYL